MAKTPETFVREYNGKAIDDDGAYDVQCVDGLRIGCKYLGIPVIPTPNNWADGYWTCKDENGNLDQATKNWQSEYFLKVPVSELTDGCWVVWPRGCKSHPSSHVAMYYHGQEFGERQYEGNRAFCLKSTDFSDALGGLMPKAWAYASAPEWDFDVTINGHLYHMYGQSAGITPIVLSPGLNKVAKIRDTDCGYEVFAKITGCNFYQAKNSVPGQPYGMTFGDISSPICGVYQSLPGQDSTMFYDIEADAYGDCTGVNVNAEHNVYSPVLIYPTGKNVQYARMVGLSHTKDPNFYAFVIRMISGQFVLGLTAQKLSPDQIVVDLLDEYPGIDKVMFIDGGGSAQMMRYKVKEKQIEYTRDTDTPTAGAIAFIGEPIAKPQPKPDPAPQEPEIKPQEPETGKDDEQTMEPEKPQEKPQEQPDIQIIPDWKDPDAGKKTIYDRIVALMAVKSIFSIVALGLFAFLTINGKISSEQFMTVFATIMAFYFGTTYQKNGGGGD